MSGPTLTYLSMDSVQRGVGASQVLPYVRGLAEAGVSVSLLSFERGEVSTQLSNELSRIGVEWSPLPFGSEGAIGGLGRVLRMAAAVRGDGWIHARSDMAAAAAMLRARRRPWLWDVRSFWIDQRIALDGGGTNCVVRAIMRFIERRAARRSSAIVTLTAAAIEELAARHGDGVRSKATVITTCVALDRFRPSAFPDEPVKVLLAGSVNALYDQDSMVALIKQLQLLRRVEVTFLRPEPTDLDEIIRGLGGVVTSSTFDQMPEHVASHHVGLSICRTDSSAAIVAAMPTKIGEFLSCGRPVVVNRGLGDCDELFERTHAGVVLADRTPASIERAAHDLIALLGDPRTPERCRRAAEQHFNLQAGVRSLSTIYLSSDEH